MARSPRSVPRSTRRPSQPEPDPHDVPTMSIGEVAVRLNVSVQAVRLYEQRGLILVRKGPGGQRQYSESDVERLTCIREAITGHKISIEGIRRLQSLIPCWETVRCPMPDRLACPAYKKAEAGCWTHEDRDDICRHADCRRCEVYLLSARCDTIKYLIHRLPVPHAIPRRPPHKELQA